MQRTSSTSLTMQPRAAPVRVRSLFISDVHLGTRGCQAELLCDFLRHHEAERIYLVGDIIEGSRLPHRVAWPSSHLDLVQELLKRARAGADVIYVLGNHDAQIAEFIAEHLSGVTIVREAMHQALNGQRYLVVHGDQFDVVMEYAPWLGLVGAAAYQALLSVNLALNMARRSLGLGYWSISAWAKARIKDVVTFISRFEEKLSAEARRKQVHGVVCGHIHHAAQHTLAGVHYLNAGDWVESCTAILETHDGRFEVVHWRSMVSS